MKFGDFRRNFGQYIMYFEELQNRWTHESDGNPKRSNFVFARRKADHDDQHEVIPRDEVKQYIFGDGQPTNRLIEDQDA